MLTNSGTTPDITGFAIDARRPGHRARPGRRRAVAARHRRARRARRPRSASGTPRAARSRSRSRRVALEARADGLPEHKPSSRFEQVEPDLFRTVAGRENGELLRVTRDADGRVTKMNWATYLFTREPLAFGEWL